jgi:hypothetical protein
MISEVDVGVAEIVMEAATTWVAADRTQILSQIIQTVEMLGEAAVEIAETVIIIEAIWICQTYRHLELTVEEIQAIKVGAAVEI